MKDFKASVGLGFWVCPLFRWFVNWFVTVVDGVCFVCVVLLFVGSGFVCVLKFGGSWLCFKCRSLA